MTGDLAEILAPANWPAWVLVSTRMGGFMLTAPLWSMAALGGATRGAIAALLSFALAPGARVANLPTDYQGLMVPEAGELLLGVAIGLAAGLFLDGIALAGEIMATQMGFNLGEALGMASASEGVAGVGQLQTRLALVVFVAGSGHVALLGAFAESFQAIPAGGTFTAGGSRVLVELAGTVFSTAVRAAAPVMVSLLLVNIGLAILGRAVPQLNAMVFSFPITIAVGLVVLGATAPFLGAFAGQWTSGVVPVTQRVIGAYAGAGR